MLSPVIGWVWILYFSLLPSCESSFFFLPMSLLHPTILKWNSKWLTFDWTCLHYRNLLSILLPYTLTSILYKLISKQMLTNYSRQILCLNILLTSPGVTNYTNFPVLDELVSQSSYVSDTINVYQLSQLCINDSKHNKLPITDIK